jgi:hypothetical protein
MHSFDALSWHVMNAMADDWESIEQIRPVVYRHHGQASDKRIFQILRQLHENELIRVMDEDGYATAAFPADPTACWFSMTETGQTLWDSEATKYWNEHQEI